MTGDQRSDLALEVWSFLLAFVQQTTKAAERDMADLPLTPAQYLALVMVDDHGPQRQIDLADRLRATEASVSQMVTRMESHGLVHRHSDGRANLVDLTEEGRAFLDMARPRHRAHIAGRFDDLSHDQLLELRTLLGRVAHHESP